MAKTDANTTAGTKRVNGANEELMRVPGSPVGKRETRKLTVMISIFSICLIHF